MATVRQIGLVRSLFDNVRRSLHVEVKMKIRLIAAVASFGTTVAASGAFTGLSAEFAGTTSVPGPGFLAIRIFANFNDPNDRLLSVTGANYAPCGGASFYQHPFGSATEPNPALIAAFPDLQWDSFVTIGLTQFGDPGTPLTALEPGSSFTTTSFIGGYFTDGDSPQGVAGADGKVMLAQLTIENPTVTSGVMGSMTIAWKAAGGTGATFSDAAFESLACVPSPGMLAALALAAAYGRSRRR
jgi:hypothetical protein